MIYISDRSKLRSSSGQNYFHTLFSLYSGASYFHDGFGRKNSRVSRTKSRRLNIANLILNSDWKIMIRLIFRQFKEWISFIECRWVSSTSGSNDQLYSLAHWKIIKSIQSFLITISREPIEVFSGYSWILS